MLEERGEGGALDKLAYSIGVSDHECLSVLPSDYDID